MVFAAAGALHDLAHEDRYPAEGVDGPVNEWGLRGRRRESLAEKVVIPGLLVIELGKETRDLGRRVDDSIPEVDGRDTSVNYLAVSSSSTL